MWYFFFMFVQISEDEITFLTGGDDPYDDNVVLKKLLIVFLGQNDLT